MHYAHERERPSMRMFRDKEEGKGDDQLPNYIVINPFATLPLCTCATAV